MESDWESVVEPSSTCTVKSGEPAVVGVPEMTPVEVFNDSPAGSEPIDMDQVYEPVPPVACKVWE